MSKPVKPWRETDDATGAEARAAELFKKALPPREASPAVQARQLAVLRGEAFAPRRFRLSMPAAVAIFFGASMALAATRSDFREWVREKMEAAGVLEPKGHAGPATPLEVNRVGSASAVANAGPSTAPSASPRMNGAGPDSTATPAEPERVMEMDALDVSDGGPAAVAVALPPIGKPPANRPTVAAGIPARGSAGPKPVKTAPSGAAPTATEEEDVVAPPVVPPQVEPTPASPGNKSTEKKPAVGGGLVEGDLPADITGASPAQRIEILLRHGDVDEAAEVLNQQRGDKSDRMNLLRGEVLRERMMCLQANVYFTAVIQTAGVAPALLERALYGRVKCHQWLGNIPDEKRDLERYKKAFPNGRL